MLLVLAPVGCASGRESEAKAPTGETWACGPNERTFGSTDPSEPPADRTLEEAAALVLRKPYEVVKRTEKAAVLQRFADDSIAAEYTFARWQDDRGGWYLETSEQCR